jgi:hypothetical protein
VVFTSGRFEVGPRTVQKSAQGCFVPVLLAAFFVLTTAGAALAASGFNPQARLGYHNGDQWEPAIAADGRGHLYVLYPQYGAVPDCPRCTPPSIALLVSNDNGVSWQASKAMLPFSTGQFDPQIVVDPVDRQTVYASWMQNNKRDIIVARSLDFGRTWSFSWAERGREDADKPVLAVRGTDVYVGFNHDEKFFVATSHDAGQTFSRVQVNANAAPGSSLAGGATIDPAGNVYFGWTAYARHEMANRPVSVFVSRSADGGRTWGTLLLDVSSAPPECEAQGCATGYLGAQIALASDAAGALYALWNAGTANGGPERIYFSSSTTGGASWSERVNVSRAAPGVEHGFPALVAGAPGDVRIAWMDARAADAGHPSRRLWNTFYRNSTNGGATWNAETRLSGPAEGYDYALPAGFRFPFGDYFGLTIDSDGATHAVWGEGRDYKSPGSIWYTHGR